MNRKMPFTKTHIQMATCSYAGQRGDKKTYNGSKLCSSVCRFSVMDAQWQESTPDNYRLFLCLLLPLPSSCSPQPALLSPSAGLLRSKNILQKRTAISTAAQNVGSEMQELMGSFIGFLTSWQGQAAEDMLALSLLEIKEV